MNGPAGRKEFDSPEKAAAPLEVSIPLEEPARRGALYGTADRNLRLIRNAFDVRITARDDLVRIVGPADAVHRAAAVVDELQRHLRHHAVITDSEVEDSIRVATRTRPFEARTLDVFVSSASLSPRGEGQRRYVQAIQDHDLIFCVGPSGTGKTYLAVAVAVTQLKQQRIKRIVLVRPAVEAGEKLGYLPGDLQAKVNPYLRPLFDAMHDMMSFEQIKRFMQNDIIEVVPLAFMRGRTLNHALIILDEAQNATVSQMLMFLTRLGNQSKMVVTGDESQSDLPNGEPRGFSDAIHRLEGVEGVAVVRLQQSDIVRHPLVQRVVEVYSRNAPNVQ
jgi:phosphate starvation-inducible PhoH-like protein